MTTLSLFNAIATAAKTIFEVAQGASNSDAKRQLMEVYDTLMNLKRQASELEDENRELKDKLRFKGSDFKFEPPFWFEKYRPDVALCPKCFQNGKIGSMGKEAPEYRGIKGSRGVHSVRRCAACGHEVEVD
jgi:hypothetical protein